MKSFRDWSIRYKLTGLFVAMACITTVAISLPLGVFDLWENRAAMARDLATLTDVLARNSTAAITFRDADAARDVLQALRAEPSITVACVYTGDGKPFAKYVRQGEDSGFVPPPPQAQTTRFERHRLVQFRRIVLSGETVGTIYIESDLRRLDRRIREENLVFLAALFVTMSLAFFLASRFQRPISRPLINLVQTAKAISIAADYSIRSDLQNRDEFGLLVSAFNGMLDQIEKRDRELRQYREHLEEQVASRTAELSNANTKLKLQAAALEAAANAIVITDLNGAIAWSNPAFSALSGYSAREVLGRNPRFLSSGRQDKDFYSRMWAAIASGKMWHGEMVNRRKDGSCYTEEMTITPVGLEGSGVTHFVAIKQDITQRKQAEEALRQAEEKYRAIFEDAVVGIFQTTPKGRPLSINRALAQMHGYDSPEQLLAEVPNVVERLFVDPGRMKELKRALDKNGVVRGAEVELYRRDRTKKWVMVNLRAVYDAAGNIVLHEGTLEDISDRKVAEERIQFLAYYDAFTGLPNRTFLRDILAKALAGARRRKEKIALLFLDLDRFKIINDSLGHSFGDLLLQEVAGRLKRWAREQDTVARVGGDEFLIMVTAVKSAADVAAAAQRILHAMTAEFVIQDYRFSVSGSIGISIFPEHGIDGETLIKNADAAMYCAKDSGPNTFQFFTEDMNTQVVERLTLGNSLRQALDNGELSLVYQPQREMATGMIVGLEALLRWQHPELGLVSPDKFIRVAEASGLIIPIGDWVLRTACSQVRQWQDEGLLAVPVAVNVSALQFRQAGFPAVIKNMLGESGLDPQYLELELTESTLLSNADVMFPVLEELRAMGLKLAIDDFGTGYSSLSYLKQLPVSKLKIDRSFVRDVALNPDDAAITAAIISMAKALNLKVIAEGVENESQMSFLRAHHCDQIQGYYFSKPLTADQVAEKLAGQFGLRFIHKSRGRNSLAQKTTVIGPL
ncbi:MAG TPA: EAL domain-containing protein [Terriglobales bacterium]|jgi:diguanylate cyclase (GGDEF)-like protein/PAS domain S-box-containing protein